MLLIEGLSKSFDGFLALHDVRLEIGAGSRHAIIGPNGAGKTTLFNCVTGHLPASAGRVLFKGMAISGLAPHAISKLGIARSFQRINIFTRLSVPENVQAALIVDRGHHFNLFKPGGGLYRDDAAAVLEMVGLEAEADHAAGLLAYGKQKQLELAIALAAEPELLLLDEPTAGMSPQETRDTIELVAGIVARRGLTLLFTEHDMDVVFQIADRISVLHHGEIIASGTPREVRENERVRQVYLGDVDHAPA